MGDARRSTLGSLSDVLLVGLVAVLLFVLCGLAFDNAFGADGPVYSQVTPPTVGAACSPSARPPVIDPATMRAYICVSGAWQVKGLPECNAATPTSPSCSASSKPVCIWTGSTPPALWGCNSSNAWEQIGGGGGGAPTTAGYWTKQSEAGLSNEIALGSLGSGLVINTTGTGIPTILSAQTCTNTFVRSYTASGTVTCNAVDLNADTAATALPLAKITDDGTAGKVLTSGGAGGDPSWTSAGAGDITSVGDRTANAAFDPATTNSGSNLCWWDGGTAGNENSTCIDNSASGQVANYSLTFPKISGALCVKGDSACGTWATGTDYNQDGTLPQVSYDSGNAVLSFNPSLAGTPDMKVDYDSGRGTYYYLKGSLCTVGATLYCSTGTPTKGADAYCFDGAGALLWCDSSGSGTWTAVNASAGSSHAILSATHTDALAGSVTRGDVIYGNATPKWARLAKGSTGQCLTSTATDVAWGSCGGTPAWATRGIDSGGDGTNPALDLDAASDYFTVNPAEGTGTDFRLYSGRLIDSDGNSTTDLSIQSGIIGGTRGNSTDPQRFAIFPGGYATDPFDYTMGTVFETDTIGNHDVYPVHSKDAGQGKGSLGTTDHPWDSVKVTVLTIGTTATFNNIGYGNTFEGAPNFWNSGTAQSWLVDSDFDDSATRNFLWQYRAGATSNDRPLMWLDANSLKSIWWINPDGDSSAAPGSITSYELAVDASNDQIILDPDGSAAGTNYKFCGGDSHASGDTLIYNSGTGCWASRTETAAPFTFSFTNLAGTATNVMRPAGVYGDGFTRWYTTYAITLKGMTCYVNAAKTGGTMSVTAKVAAGNTDITLGTGTTWAITTPYSDTTCTSNCNVAADGYVALDAVTSSFLPAASDDLQCQIFYVMQ